MRVGTLTQASETPDRQSAAGSPSHRVSEYCSPVQLNRTRHDKMLGAAIGGGPLLGGMIVHYGLGGSPLWFLAFYAVAVAAYLADRRSRRAVSHQN